MKAKTKINLNTMTGCVETMPRYSPLIVQKGDRVVYLRDAHQLYLENEIQQL